MTVLDTSGAIDFLLGTGCAAQVGELFRREGILAAPDLLTFELMAVLRRQSHAGAITSERARLAVDDMGDLAVEVFPALPLRSRVWELRDNMTVGDGFFVALAERLHESLATKDRRLAAAARTHAGIEVVELG